MTRLLVIVGLLALSGASSGAQLTQRTAGRGQTHSQPAPGHPTRPAHRKGLSFVCRPCGIELLRSIRTHNHLLFAAREPGSSRGALWCQCIDELAHRLVSRIGLGMQAFRQDFVNPARHMTPGLRLQLRIFSSLEESRNGVGLKGAPAVERLVKDCESRAMLWASFSRRERCASLASVSTRCKSLTATLRWSSGS